MSYLTFRYQPRSWKIARLQCFSSTHTDTVPSPLPPCSKTLKRCPEECSLFARWMSLLTCVSTPSIGSGLCESMMCFLKSCQDLESSQGVSPFYESPRTWLTSAYSFQLSNFHHVTSERQYQTSGHKCLVLGCTSYLMATNLCWWYFYCCLVTRKTSAQEQKARKKKYE